MSTMNLIMELKQEKQTNIQTNNKARQTLVRISDPFIFSLINLRIHAGNVMLTNLLEHEGPLRTLFISIFKLDALDNCVTSNSLVNWLRYEEAM